MKWKKVEQVQRSTNVRPFENSSRLTSISFYIKQSNCLDNHNILHSLPLPFRPLQEILCWNRLKQYYRWQNSRLQYSKWPLHFFLLKLCCACRRTMCLAVNYQLASNHASKSKRNCRKGIHDSSIKAFRTLIVAFYLPRPWHQFFHATYQRIDSYKLVYFYG